MSFQLPTCSTHPWPWEDRKHREDREELDLFWRDLWGKWSPHLPFFAQVLRPCWGISFRERGLKMVFGAPGGPRAWSRLNRALTVRWTKWWLVSFLLRMLGSKKKRKCHMHNRNRPLAQNFQANRYLRVQPTFVTRKRWQNPRGPQPGGLSPVGFWLMGGLSIFLDSVFQNALRNAWEGTTKLSHIHIHTSYYILHIILYYIYIIYSIFARWVE